MHFNGDNWDILPDDEFAVDREALWMLRRLRICKIAAKAGTFVTWILAWSDQRWMRSVHAREFIILPNIWFFRLRASFLRGAS